MEGGLGILLFELRLDGRGKGRERLGERSERGLLGCWSRTLGWRASGGGGRSSAKGRGGSRRGTLGIREGTLAGKEEGESWGEKVDRERGSA